MDCTYMPYLLSISFEMAVHFAASPTCEEQTRITQHFNSPYRLNQNDLFLFTHCRWKIIVEEKKKISGLNGI